MKRSQEKKPFYLNRNWVIGFVVSLAAVFVFYFLESRPSECEIQLSLFKLNRAGRLKEVHFRATPAQCGVERRDHVYSARLAAIRPAAGGGRSVDLYR